LDEDKAEAIRHMKMTLGWQEVERFILSRIEDNKNKLEHCRIDEVENIRSELKAYRSILEHIERIEHYQNFGDPV